MPNRNYEKGRRYEYETVKKEKAEGCIAFRTAGSHSPIDVISIDMASRVILLIQCKTGKASQKKLKSNFERTDTYTVIWELREK